MAAADPVEWLRSLFIQLEAQQQSIPPGQSAGTGTDSQAGVGTAAPVGVNLGSATTSGISTTTAAGITVIPPPSTAPSMPIEWLRALFIELGAQQQSIPALGAAGSAVSVGVAEPAAAGQVINTGTASGVGAGRAWANGTTKGAPTPAPAMPAEWMLTLFLQQPTSPSVRPTTGQASASDSQQSLGTVAATQIVLSASANTAGQRSTGVSAGLLVGTATPPPPPMPVEWLRSLFIQLPTPIYLPANTGSATDSQQSLGIANATLVTSTSTFTAGRGLGTAAGQVISRAAPRPPLPAEWMLTLFLQQPVSPSVPTTTGAARDSQAGIGSAAGQVVNTATGTDSQAGLGEATPVGVNLGTAPAVQRSVGVAAAVNVLDGFAAGAVQVATGTAAAVQQPPVVAPPVLPAWIILGQFGLDAVLYQAAPSTTTTTVLAGTANTVQEAAGYATAIVINPGHAATVGRGIGRATFVAVPTAVGALRGTGHATPVGISVGAARGVGHGASKSGPFVITVGTANGGQRSYLIAYGHAILPAATHSLQLSTGAATAVLVHPDLTILPGLVSPKSLAGTVRPKELAGIDSS